MREGGGERVEVDMAKYTLQQRVVLNYTILTNCLCQLWKRRTHYWYQ